MKKIPVGTHVRVIDPIDGEMDLKFWGLEGTVERHNTNGATGNTEEVPLYEVMFSIAGCGYPVREQFWRQELEIIKGKPKTKQAYNEKVIIPNHHPDDGASSNESGQPQQQQETGSGRDVFDLYPEAGESDNLQRQDLRPPEQGIWGDNDKGNNLI